MLSNIYEEQRHGPLIVKYDMTIQNFRRDIQAFLKMLF